MKRFALLSGLLLAGCAVGPNYVKPTLAPTRTGAFVDPATTAPAVNPAAPAEEQWWHLFNDPVLDRLVVDALAYNTDVRAAVANVAKARALLSQARGAQLPTTTVSGGAQRQRVGAATAGLSGGAGGTGGTGGVPSTGTGSGPSHYDFDLYTAGFAASYEVDLFGRVRRSVEAARADYQAAAADLDTARVSVAAETARTYAASCSAAAQAQVARETAELQDKTYDLTKRLFDAGRGTRREMDQAQVLAENARALVPGFEAERRASLYALAALTGRPPAEIDTEAAQCVATPTLGAAIPIGDGAALLARRPDVRAAEQRLAAETARIGVATGDLFPKISIGGNASLAATRFGDLGKASSFSFALGPLLSWSFPNITVARARIRQARASSEAALANFDGAVLTALKETEQALARYAGALDQQAARTRAAQAAENAAGLSRIRFDAGRDSFLQLLDAERDRSSARTALAQARASTAAAQVDLFKALGGGWQTADRSR
jgi:NodT family efflux transporter outer membrane factor (OMF) lipoprotein